MNDSAALVTAPHGAKRLSRHVLTINYHKGTKRFVDRPPFQEAYGGAHWYYCGYAPSLHAHLVGKNENGLFSGVLLLDDSSKSLTGLTMVCCMQRRSAPARLTRKASRRSYQIGAPGSGGPIYIAVLTNQSGNSNP